MLKKSFKNTELGIEMNSFIDNKQNIWFRGKDVAQILGYRDTKKAIKLYVSKENKIIQLIQPNVGGYKTPPQQNDTREKCCPGKTPGQENDVGWYKTPPQQNDTRRKYCTVINEPGFYELVFSSELEFAKKSMGIYHSSSIYP